MSASFGVVLEGPMAAVIFWSMLGLANASPARRRNPGCGTVRRPAGVGGNRQVQVIRHAGTRALHGRRFAGRCLSCPPLPASLYFSAPVKFLRNLDLASFFKLTTREHFDRITPVCIFGLSLFGVIFIYSAQLARDGGQCGSR